MRYFGTVSKIEFLVFTYKYKYCMLSRIFECCTCEAQLVAFSSSQKTKNKNALLKEREGCKRTGFYNI